MSSLGSRGVPALVELAGFNAAVVLPDAPVEATVRALTRASFVGAGQTCVAAKRVIVVDDPTPWADALGRAADELRVGNPGSGIVDLGPMISVTARDQFHVTIQAAIGRGAKRLAGGEIPPGNGSFYPPTVLLADDPATDLAIQDELAGRFGPVVLVRGVLDDAAAIEAANSGRFGLAASVWGRDRRRTTLLAEQIQAGSIAINEAVTTSAHAAAPFGGRGLSGFGRIRGVVGLRDLARTQVIHTRRPGGFRPHLFPYSSRMRTIFAVYRRIFHRGG